jgi:hypothetical protein
VLDDEKLIAIVDRSAGAVFKAYHALGHSMAHPLIPY